MEDMMLTQRRHGQARHVQPGLQHLSYRINPKRGPGKYVAAMCSVRDPAIDYPAVN
jgi:hypothetical protein